MTTCQESVQLGAYLLGALDPEERSVLEQHIAGCADCQAELLAMAPLPGLLRRTPFEELDETAAAAQRFTPTGPVTADTKPLPMPEPRLLPEPEPLPLPQPQPQPQPFSEPQQLSEATTGAGGATHHAAERRPRRRLLVSAGIALAGAAAAVGAWVYVGGASSTSSTPPSAATTVSAVDAQTHVTATAALTPENWGTQVQLKLGNLPSGITCHLVVHARDGRTETAGTWGSGYSAATTVPASTSIGSSDIQAMDVVDSGGTVLVHLPG